MGKWILGENKPSDNRDVLVFAFDEVSVGWWEEDAQSWYFDDGASLPADEIDAWMEIPNPPNI